MLCSLKRRKPLFPTFNDAAADDWQRAHDEDADTALRKLWESVIGGKGEENYVSPSVLHS